MYNSNWWNEYRRFLKSPEWQQVRRRAFARYGKRCDCCKAVNQIQVHHLSYTNYKNPSLEDVIPACWYCHAALKSEQSTSRLKGKQLWLWHKQRCRRNRR